MYIKILKSKPKEVSQFTKKEWKKADNEHYDIKTDWKKEKYRLVAYKGNEIIGTLSLEIQAKVAYVESLIVSDIHRREGVGKNLMRKAEGISRNQECHKIFLETGKGWKAQDFYQNLGYELTGELQKHYFEKDFIILTKWL